MNGVRRNIRPLITCFRVLSFAPALCAVAMIVNAAPVLAQATPPASQPDPAIAARLAEARKTFSASCAACHGLDGHGGERGPDIASRQVQQHSDEELLRTVRNGISETGMPNFAFLGEAKIEALVRYLRVLQGTSGPLPMPGDPQRGEVLFGGAAQCTQCHMARGAGGFIAPDLSAFAAGISPAEIRRAIVNPVQDGMQNRGKVVVTFANGSSREGVVRNEDNFSLQLQSLDGTFHLLQKSEISAVKPSEQPLAHPDYGKTLTPGQLDDLVSYLMHIAENNPPRDPAKKKH
ncbi:MAG: c-type cytochrome [Acidobacteriota bacterium]|nr:c-type cytochrome [Acidobacteriota bacterium]